MEHASTTDADMLDRVWIEQGQKDFHCNPEREGVDGVVPIIYDDAISKFTLMDIDTIAFDLIKEMEK